MTVKLFRDSSVIFYYLLELTNENEKTFKGEQAWNPALAYSP